MRPYQPTGNRRTPFLAEALQPRILLATVTWTGASGDGLWHTPGNWSGMQVPTIADDVAIDLPGTYAVFIVDQPASAKSLALGAVTGSQTLSVNERLTLPDISIVRPTGILALNPGGEIAEGYLNVNGGRFDWNGGTQSGGLDSQTSFNNGAVLNIGGPDAKTLAARDVFGGADATLNWTQGDVSLHGASVSISGVLNVSATATMRAIGGGSLGMGGGAFHQSGGTTIIDASFHLAPTGSAIVDGTLVLAGGGVVFGSSAVNGTLVVREEHLRLGAIAGGGTVRFASGSHTLGGDATGLPLLEVLNDGTVVQVGRLDVGTLAIRSGAQLKFNTAIPARVRALQMDAVSRVELFLNSLVIDYSGPSPLEDVRSLVSSGYTGGAWSGAGIGTSALFSETMGVGYAESRALFNAFPASFDGFVVDDTSILMRRTLYGDANLDRNVNLLDFARLLDNFNRTGAVWTEGNFNYDNRTNLPDFNLLASKFGSISWLGPAPDDGSVIELVDRLH
jgi:hypothetical protein